MATIKYWESMSGHADYRFRIFTKRGPVIWGSVWKARGESRPGWYAQTDEGQERKVTPDFGKTRHEAVATAGGI